MPDREDVQRLNEEIYEAALDPDQWPRVLESLARSFGSASAHLSVENFAMTEGQVLSFGSDPAFGLSYAEHYAKSNVLWQRMVRMQLDQVMTDQTVMPKAELRRSEFYNDWLRPQGGDEILISTAWRLPDRATTLTLWRPERLGSWETDHVGMLTAITPHVRHALRVNHAAGQARVVHDLAKEALHHLENGVILVDATAKVMFANRAAEAIFADGSGLRVERGRLAAVRPSDDGALARAIATAAIKAVGATVAISRGAHRPLVVTAVPAKGDVYPFLHERRSAMLFIKDPERSAGPLLTAFAHHFDLTPAQAALAREIVRADGVAAAAARLGIAYATARTHLLNIFHKTGTRRQTELVRLILDWNEQLTMP